MSQTCQNCGALVKSKYCPECGQKGEIGRLNMHAILHEFWHGFTHTDAGVIRLWLDLLLHPRRTYENYFAGHRKHYFSPVMFFLVSFGIYIYLDQKVFDYQDHIVALKTGHIFNDQYGRYIQEHAKVVALIMLPIQSILSWALFFQRRNLAECIVFWLFLTGFINTIQSLLTPLRLLTIDHKDLMDYLLNLLTIAIILFHSMAVFGNNIGNKFVVAILVFALSIVNYYVFYYFEAQVASVAGKLPWPNIWEAIQDIYGNQGTSVLGIKIEHYRRY